MWSYSSTPSLLFCLFLKDLFNIFVDFAFLMNSREHLNTQLKSVYFLHRSELWKYLQCVRRDAVYHGICGGMGRNRAQIAVSLWTKNVSPDLWLFRHGRVLNFIWREKWSQKQTEQENFRWRTLTNMADTITYVEVCFVNWRCINPVITLVLRLICCFLTYLMLGGMF
jgi:hypothetical protein